MNKILLIIVILMVSGCESRYFDVLAFKFGLKVAMKEGCDEDEKCLAKIDANFDTCADKLDYKLVLEAVDRDDESELILYITEIDVCLFGERP